MEELWLANRFKQIRLARGLKQGEFAKSLFISASYISKIEAGAKSPDESVIEMLLMKYKISTDWWETGEGEIFVDANAENAKKPSQMYAEDLFARLTEDERQRIIMIMSRRLREAPERRLRLVQSREETAPDTEHSGPKG